ncbi:MAG: DUF4287 domain-containing protein [Devosia sp.]
MSRELYLENAQAKTGKTLKQFVSLAAAQGFDSTTKAGIMVAWLKAEFGLGHGHATAVMHAIKSAGKQG